MNIPNEIPERMWWCHTCNGGVGCWGEDRDMPPPRCPACRENNFAPVKYVGVNIEALVNKAILGELRGHLTRVSEWAHPSDLEEHSGDDITPAGWSCIKSIREAVESGKVGLALTRWDDLMGKPMLSALAQEWREL